jgi:DNA replication protein DnaC
MKRIEENLRNRSPSEEQEEQIRINKSLEEERQTKASNLFHLANVPRRHASLKFDAVGLWKESYEKLEENLGTGMIFVLMGIRGTGKTQMGVNLIKKNSYLGHTSKYTKAIDIFIDLRSSFRKDGDNENGIISKYVLPKLLVIDAMEERGETSFEDRLLNHIIDKRYDNMYDTILITNQNSEKFSESVGTSIISRIQETGSKIVCEWESFRANKKLGL